MTSSTHNNLHILVVDDETFVLNLTVRVLKKLGYEDVEIATDGKLAINKLVTSETAFDLIICDLNMPEMDGVEFMRHINNTEFDGSMILLSGEDERMLETAFVLAEAHNLKVLGAISKPLKPDLLKELLNKSQSNDQVEKRHFEPEKPISEEELRAGITGYDYNELYLVYQPKISIPTGEIIGVETLARWKHPERGILGPGAFIPLAEKTGMIVELTYQIYRQTLQQSSDWLLEGIDTKNSVNISIASFADPGFCDFIINTTKEAGVDPSQIILEVTETQVMTKVTDCIENMLRMRLKKFGLSIDDFGTGNSSLGKLKNIPFTEVKIDKAFVTGAAKNAGARAILETSIDLGKKLKMDIIAEGAETREDWDLVEELGCDYVQGFYCARPMPNEEFMQFLENWNGPH